ncbi:FixH family protein [Vibrio sp. Isolate34]|uniref:FixH family protein n=1 Tax=Vibrio sp. Isolate34 TaxID=2908540 RepID=UPI001EFE9903|nr:FixH family protein [Vibrio sp. Isolate34]MCG9640399.1 FixH family protein [Vibrio sp. Isolate34]
MVKPWYKQFWPWFLIALPATVVIWTIMTVIVFTQNSVDLVTEDYYKKGKGINVDISKVNIAKELGLSASLNEKGNSVIITLDKGKLDHFPAISAMFVHRTLPDRDFTQLLTADARGNYTLTLDHEMQGPWFIELTPHDEEWLVQGRMNFPIETPTQLTN